MTLRPDQAEQPLSSITVAGKRAHPGTWSLLSLAELLPILARLPPATAAGALAGESPSLSKGQQVTSLLPLTRAGWLQERCRAEPRQRRGAGWD